MSEPDKPYVPKYEIWSCNPADIPEWTPEAEARLKEALAGIFGWKKKEDDDREIPS